MVYMPKIIKICCICLAMLVGHGVALADYDDDDIRDYVAAAPRNSENNIKTLTRYLTKPFNNDYDKAKAIAFWIAGHINYDQYFYNNGKTTRLYNTYKGQSPNDLLKSRAGICADFARLFKEMCQSANIKAYEVSGYAFSSDKLRTTASLRYAGHAWNYFLYNNNKIYVDTTFMSRGATKLLGKKVTNIRHRRALREIRRQNKHNSVMKDFDEFYFDFSYKEEEKQRHWRRIEWR